jgi:hypothetical protein
LKTAEQLVPELAKHFASMKDPTEAILDAFKLFDSEGVALLQLLKLGPTQIARLREGFRAMGATVTRDLVEKSMAFNAAVLELRAAFTGLGNKMAIALLPGMTRFVELMTHWIQQVEPLARRGLNLLGSAMDVVTGAIDRIRPAFQTLRGVLVGVGVGAGLYGAIVLVKNGFRNMAAAIRAVNVRLVVTIASFAALIAGFQFAARKGWLQTLFPQLKEEIDATSTAIDELFEKLKTFLEKFYGAAKGTGRETAPGGGPLEVFPDALKKSIPLAGALGNALAAATARGLEGFKEIGAYIRDILIGQILGKLFTNAFTSILGAIIPGGSFIGGVLGVGRAGGQLGTARAPGVPGVMVNFQLGPETIVRAISLDPRAGQELYRRVIQPEELVFGAR